MRKLLRRLSNARAIFWRFVLACLALVPKALHVVDDVLSDNGQRSASRWCMAIITICVCYVMVHRMDIPEHVDQAAYLIAATYGANQLGNVAQRLLAYAKGGPSSGDSGTPEQGA